MPRGCVVSVISSFLIMVAAAALVIDYFTNYQELGLCSVFCQYPSLRFLAYLILGLGVIGLVIGLKIVFFGRQEEPYSTRGGLVNKAYKDGDYDKI